MVNPRLCETARPLFKNPRPNYKSSRLRDCSTCREPEIPRLFFRMPRFRVVNVDDYFNCQGVYKFSLCNQLLKINFDDQDSQCFGYVF